MAVGDVSISGAFSVDATSRADIETFIEAQLGAVTNSGSHIFILPDEDTRKFWVGVRLGAQG